MNIVHNTRELKYRDPFGALPTDAYVQLEIEIEDAEVGVDFVLLHYAYGLTAFARGQVMMRTFTESNLTQAHNHHSVGKSDRFRTRLRTPDEACLLFYWFEVRTKDHLGHFVYTDPGQPGKAAWGPDAPLFGPDEEHFRFPFQITVYEADFQTPAWYAGHTMYQIFPDRFARHKDFSYNELVHARPVSERIYHEFWSEDVDIKGKPETGYIACDFYGGSLKGIRENLAHLSMLGIKVLYLNPIFAARSNHRYDTANYMEIDPILGTMEDFDQLVNEARSHGIGIILDGVFSHTGADSLYFNKYGRFPGMGAYRAAQQKAPSRFYGWYNIKVDERNVYYDSWWGFPELPAVNEFDLSFREYIFGPEGVLAFWLKRGVMGFRLDVSDELPDGFIRSVRRTVKKYNPNAVVLGEVWEDASCKISYGNYRDFILGNTHDSIMNYPFRDVILAFCKWQIDAPRLRDLLDNIRENYPPMAFAANMNLLSSHDTPRFITSAAGQEDPGSRAQHAHIYLSPEERLRGEMLLKFAYSVAFLYPGSPCIYYGDERGMEGYRDPFNRRTFPWQHPPGDIQEHLVKLAGLRNSYQVLRTGHIKWLKCSERGFSFSRFFHQGKDLLEHEGKGPQKAVISCNGGSEPWTNDTGQLIPPGQILVEIEGMPHFFLS